MMLAWLLSYAKQVMTSPRKMMKPNNAQGRSILLISTGEAQQSRLSRLLSPLSPRRTRNLWGFYETKRSEEN